MDSKAIGLRIEQQRKQLGLTLEFVANEIGVAKSTVMRYERGTIEKMKLPVIEAIARVLDVNPAWLCCKIDDKSRERLNDDIAMELNAIELTPAENHLLSLFRELNEEGQEKLVDYADDMVRSGKYKKNNQICLANGQT